MKRKKQSFQKQIKRFGALLLALAVFCTDGTLSTFAVEKASTETIAKEEVETVNLLSGTSFEKEITLSKEQERSVQDITGLIQGMTYTISFQAKTNGVRADSSFWLGVSGHGGEDSKLRLDSSEWRTYSMDFTYIGKESVTLSVWGENPGDSFACLKDMTLCAKGDIRDIRVENGSIHVFYHQENEKVPSAKDFSGHYLVNGQEAGELRLTEKTAEKGRLTLEFPAIVAQAAEQLITIRLSYYDGRVIPEDYNSTTDYTLEYVVPALDKAKITTLALEEAAGNVLLSEEGEAEKTNLVFNPGFEKELTKLSTGMGNLIGAWNRFVATNPEDTATRTTEEVKSGQYAGRISANGAALEQDIANLQVGKTYEFKAWVKLSEGATNTNFILGVKNHVPNTGTEVQKTVTSHEWTQLSGEFVFDNGTNPARIYLYAASANGAKAYIDDVTVVCKEDDGTQLRELESGGGFLKNPSFEKDLTEKTAEDASLAGNWNGKVLQDNLKLTTRDSQRTNVKSGIFSGKLTATDALLEQEVEGLTKGATYIFSIYGKITGGTKDTIVNIGIKNFGEEEKTTGILSGEWASYSVEFTYTGEQLPRVFVHGKNLENGAVAYVDDASLVLKSEIDTERSLIENGRMTLAFPKDYRGELSDKSIDGFTAVYKTDTGENEIELPLSFVAADTNNKTLTLGFPPIAAGEGRQLVTVTINYTQQNGCEDRVQLVYAVEPEGTDYGTIQTMEATNGRLTMTLDKIPVVGQQQVAPQEGDFEFTYALNGSLEYFPLEIGSLQWDQESKTVAVTFPAFPGSVLGEQSAKIKAVYRGNRTGAKQARFVIEKSTGNTYYVSNSGDDNNRGTSEAAPFATIQKLNQIVFQPGDKILFKKGDTFQGWFKPKGSGKAGAPIVISSYGEGEEKPTLQPTTQNESTYLISGDSYEANAQVNYVIQFVNVEYWEVRDLEIEDPNRATSTVFKSGITIQANDTVPYTDTVLEHFVIDNCNIHGFHGPLSNFGKTSGGITMNVITSRERRINKTAVKMQLNDIQITNNEIWDVGRSGINFLNVWSDRQDAAKWGDNLGVQQGLEWTPSENFVLRNNYIHHVDGDGAIIDNTLNAIVEYNLVHDCVQNLTGGAQFAVGLFNWNATNTTFQYNEVFDIRFGGSWAADCQGIEIDAWNDTTYVQYNYVHDNKGGFMMFCSHNTEEGDKSGLRSYDNIVRYNISQNDFAHPWMGIFNLGEWNIGGEIYNNTLYFTERALCVEDRNDADAEPGQFYMFQSIGGKEVMKFYNNIFYYDYTKTSTREKATINKFGDDHIDWRSNIFYGFTNKPKDDDPRYPNLHLDADSPDILTNPGGGTRGSYVKGHEQLGRQADLTAYHLPENSPARNKGIPIKDNGGLDYYGNPVTGIPDIGAHETGSVLFEVHSLVYDIDQENRIISLPKNDKATVEDLLDRLVYEEPVVVQVVRDQKVLSSKVRVAEGDRLLASYQDETLTYTIREFQGGGIVAEYIPLEYLRATAGSQQTADDQGAEKVLDKDPRTFWHVVWEGSTPDQHWITLEVTKPYKITGYEYTPRLGGYNTGATNGIVKEYQISTSDDSSGGWQLQAEGTADNGKAWPATHTPKVVMFEEPIEAKYVKMQVTSGMAGYASAAEIRLFGEPVYKETVKPQAPILTEGPNGRDRIRINWETPEDESGIGEYIIKQGDETLVVLDGDALYYDIEGLEPDKEYTYQVVAVDRAGNQSEPASITTRTTLEDGPLQYVVVFDPKNGEELTEVTIAPGEQVQLPETPVKENAIFRGWYINENGQESLFDNTKEITRNLRVYAKWSEAAAIDTTRVYWIYNVAEAENGGYAPSSQRVLFDNGGERANSGNLYTANTMYSANMGDTELRNRLMKSGWQLTKAGEDTYYLQNGFTYGYATAADSGGGGIATREGAQKEAFLVNVEEVGEDGRKYVSIRSVSRKEQGQPSYLKAQTQNPSGNGVLAVTFGETADKDQGTLWCIDEGHSFMDWENGSYLWRTARGNQHFRIPALATANDGDVIAVGDLRYNNNSDLGNGHEIDILRKIRPYHKEQGTYGEFGAESNITISFRNSGEGYGDAAIVADRESDQVLVLAAYGSEGYGGNNKAARILSTDGGETFGEGTNISDQIRQKIPEITTFFFASGRIMQSRYVKVGTHYRIYSAILACDGNTNNNVNYVLYSDDFGVNWEVLGGTSVIEKTDNNKADEAKIEELPNGDVVINSRNGNLPGRYMNVFSYNRNQDGTMDYTGGTWEAAKTKQVFENGEITSQGTNGELLTVFAKKKDNSYTHLMLHSLPSSQAPITSGTNTNRNAVTVWYKEMADPTEDSDITAAELASTWKKGRVVQDKQSAYSTMSIQADGSIGFFYEDSMTWYDLIYYHFTLDEMTGGSGEYEPAFIGIGSKKLPYQVNTQEQAVAYRDIFGREKVNFKFTEAALEKLAADNNEGADASTEGEILARAWKYVKDNQSSIVAEVEYSEEELAALLQQMAGEVDSRILAVSNGDKRIENGNTLFMGLTLILANTSVDFEIQLPVKETIVDTDYGQVLPEDVPEDGIIPEGVWVAGIKDMPYTGEKQTQSFRVYDKKKLLKEKTDYTVSYKNNTKGYEYKEEDYLEFVKEQQQDPKDKGYGTFEAGKAPQLTLKMKGNYSKNVTLYFQIIKPDLNDQSQFIVDDLWVNNTGKKQTPQPTVIWKDSGKTLKMNKDFEVVEYLKEKTNKKAFTEYKEDGYELTINGIGNFKGTKTIRLFVAKDSSKVAMSKVTVKALKPQVYTGEEQKPEIKVTYKGRRLIENQDYRILGYYNNKDVGTAYAVIEGMENTENETFFTGTRRLSFKITGTSMKKVKLLGINNLNAVYSKEAIRPMELTNEKGEQLITVVLQNKDTQQILQEGVHFTVGYEKNKEKGTGTILLTGIPSGGFTGVKKQTFKISADTIEFGQDKDFEVFLTAAHMSGEGTDHLPYEMPYVKGGAKPQVQVTYKGQALTEGQDYTVKYLNNKSAGSTATAVVKGKGNFTGSDQVSFNITVKDNDLHQEVQVAANDKLVAMGKKNGWRQSFKVVDSNGKTLSSSDYDTKNPVYQLVQVPEDSKVEVSDQPLEKNSISQIPAGSVIKITVTLSGKNYRGTASGTYRILSKDYDISKAKIEILPQYYTGEDIEITSDIQLKTAVIKSKDKDKYLYLESNEEHEANIEVVEGSYVKNRLKGTAKVTFRGLPGSEFGGTKTVSFKIQSRPVEMDNWKGIFGYIRSLLSL